MVFILFFSVQFFLLEAISVQRYLTFTKIPAPSDQNLEYKTSKINKIKIAIIA